MLMKIQILRFELTYFSLSQTNQRWDKQLQENQKCIEELVDHVHMLMVNFALSVFYFLFFYNTFLMIIISWMGRSSKKTWTPFVKVSKPIKMSWKKGIQICEAGLVKAFIVVFSIF